MTHRDANFPYKDDGFYSTDTFTDHLLTFLDERQTDPTLKSKPFFAYHAYTAPHWPLQCRKEYRDKYKGMYDAEPRELREQRLKRLVELGLVDASVSPHPMENPWKIPEWDAMTADEKAKSARAMEAYAGMVEMVDVSVGRILDKLEQDGELDNTVGTKGRQWADRKLIIFMSDK